MLTLWSSLWSSFCGNRIFMVNIEVCCHFAALVLCCLDTMLLSVWWFLSFTFSFQALFFFADCWLVLPCFLYEVIIVNTVVFKTQNNWAVKQLNSLIWFVWQVSYVIWQVTHFTHAMYSTLLITTYSLSNYKLDNIVNEKKKKKMIAMFVFSL